jgi:hypothetical protein
LFNRDNVETVNMLVICEGEFDCMALKEYGIDGVSVPIPTLSVDVVKATFVPVFVHPA